MKTTVSGVMLPPEWLPTISTAPSSGMLPSPRTSPRYHRLAASHMSGSRSRMKSGSRSSKSARGIRLCTWRATPRIARPISEGSELEPPSAGPSSEPTWPLVSAVCATPLLAISAGTSRRLAAGAVAAAPRRDVTVGRATEISLRAMKRIRSSLVCSGRSTWGTWPQSSIVTCSALGSHLRTWRPKAAGTRPSWVPHTNSAGGWSSASRG